MFWGSLKNSAKLFFFFNLIFFVLVTLFSNICFILTRDEQTWKEQQQKKQLRKILLVIFAIYLCYKSVAQMVKKSACNAGDLGSIPGLGRSPGEGKGYPLQYSGLENSIDCIVHGSTKVQRDMSVRGSWYRKIPIFLVSKLQFLTHIKIFKNN